MGMVNLKTDPSPGEDSAQILPPKVSMIFLTVARPIPEPSPDLSRREKGSNILS